MTDKEDPVSGLDEILFRENPNPILRADEEGKVILFNKACKKLLKSLAPSGKIVSIQWLKQISEVLISGFARTTEMEADGINFLVSFIPGENFTDVFATDITDLKKSISQDISERKRVLEEVLIAKGLSEESVKAKENFISIMSHEIRTPMNAVIGITNLLLREAIKPEQDELLRGLKVSSENLLKIVNNILDL
jgi:signal transduction histidine kinase